MRSFDIDGREGHLRRKDQKAYGCRIRPSTPVDSEDLRGGREIPSSCAAGDADRCLVSPHGAVRR